MSLPTPICWIPIFNQKKSSFNPKWNFRKRKFQAYLKGVGGVWWIPIINQKKSNHLHTLLCTHQYAQLMWKCPHFKKWKWKQNNRCESIKCSNSTLLQVGSNLKPIQPTNIYNNYIIVVIKKKKKKYIFAFSINSSILEGQEVFFGCIKDRKLYPWCHIGTIRPLGVEHNVHYLIRVSLKTI